MADMEKKAETVRRALVGYLDAMLKAAPTVADKTAVLAKVTAILDAFEELHGGGK